MTPTLTDTPPEAANENPEWSVDVAPCRLHPGDWRVEAVHDAGEGEIHLTIFNGPQAEKRARAYATSLFPPEAAALDLERLAAWAIYGADMRAQFKGEFELRQTVARVLAEVRAARQHAGPQGSRAGGAPDAELVDRAADIIAAKVSGPNLRSIEWRAEQRADQVAAAEVILKLFVASRPDQEAGRAGKGERIARLQREIESRQMELRHLVLGDPAQGVSGTPYFSPILPGLAR